MATPSIPAIYAITNTVNGKMYIGSASNYSKRLQKHKRELRKSTHHNNRLQRSYDKHGIESFDFSIVEYVDDHSMLLEREQVWIDFFKPTYNIAKFAGSPTRGLKFSAETRAKMSAAGKGRKRAPFSEEHRARIGESKKGQKFTAEAIAKMSAAHMGNKSHLGRTFTEEHRNNLSAAARLKRYPNGRNYTYESYSSRRKKTPQLELI